MKPSGVCMTEEDRRKNYPVAREQLKKCSSDDLIEECRTSMKACFNDIFGYNARQWYNLICDELLERGITEVPNFFGPIRIRRWER